MENLVDKKCADCSSDLNSANVLRFTFSSISQKTIDTKDKFIEEPAKKILFCKDCGQIRLDELDNL